MKRFDELNRMEAQVQSEAKEQQQKKSRGFFVLLGLIILIGAVLVGAIVKIAFFPSNRETESVPPQAPAATESAAQMTATPMVTEMSAPAVTQAPPANYAVVTAIPTAQLTATPDPIDTVLLRDDPEKGMVFGGYLSRQSIKKIIFEDAFAIPPSNAWDISASQNGSIMAWVEKSGKYYTLHIGSKSVVIADENCSGLFQGYTNLTGIEFGVYFDTSNVKDMSYMFKDCAKLKSLDLSTLNMDNVRKVDGMFEGCSKLSDLNPGSLDMGKLEKVDAFVGCESLG